MARQAHELDYAAWLARWDDQQESFNPNRERRFEAMFDILEAWLPRRFTALDLGCGPGSLSARLLRRFPAARVVAVDFDPVVLRIGQGEGYWPARELVSVSERFRPGASEVMALRVGYDKLSRETGWKPLVSWEEGIAKTIAWYAANRDRWLGRVDWLKPAAARLSN